MIKIIWLDAVDSTNNYALGRMQGLDNLSVIAARTQTAGRGQRGNRWLSRPGENLTFSLVLKFGEAPLPPLPAGRVNRLNLLAAVAVRDFLSGEGCRAVVKWPNDLYCGRKKICGILIENGLDASGVRYSVVGIGINVNQSVFDSLANATSLFLETGLRRELDPALERFAACFERRLPALYDDAAALALRADYERDLFQKDERRPYRNLLTDSEFMGILRGVDENGKAVVSPGDGSPELHFAFKELGYIL